MLFHIPNRSELAKAIELDVLCTPSLKLVKGVNSALNQEMTTLVNFLFNITPCVMYNIAVCILCVYCGVHV